MSYARKVDNIINKKNFARRSVFTDSLYNPLLYEWYHENPRIYQIFGILFLRFSVSRECINVSFKTISPLRYRIFNVTGDVN
jgi:hypothetical protein